MNDPDTWLLRGRVLVSGLRLRACPATSCKILDYLQPGDLVLWDEQQDAGEYYDYGWGRVRWTRRGESLLWEKRCDSDALKTCPWVAMFQYLPTGPDNYVGEFGG